MTFIENTKKRKSFLLFLNKNASDVSANNEVCDESLFVREGERVSNRRKVELLERQSFVAF